MNERDRQIILEEFNKSREELHAALAALTQDELGAAREGRWSPVRIVEHIAITEENLLRLGQQAQPGPAVPNPVREAKIIDKGLDRTRFIAAPDGVRPPEDLRDVAAALERFNRARAATLAWIENYQGDPRAAFTTHPMVRGPVNCYEMMLLIAIHTRRHALQITESRGSDGN